ncbi:hypothetical protein TNCV_962781 [Trichonephila clavipes]|nr:hypothetical protein TNCV_962781 [Trichonephila clavipes]
MISFIADVSCTPIGPPLPKSRPPLQTQVPNTTNIRVPDRVIKQFFLPSKRAASTFDLHLSSVELFHPSELRFGALPWGRGLR